MRFAPICIPLDLFYLEDVTDVVCEIAIHARNLITSKNCLRGLRALIVALTLAGFVSLPLSGEGLFTRQPNTTLRMPPQLESGGIRYKLLEALSGLEFDKPVDIASPPGDSSRLFVVERAGRIVVITNLANPTRTVFLDIAPNVISDWEKGSVEGLSSVAFHPEYLTSRFPFFYVTYTLQMNGPAGPGNYNRLSRFQSSRASPNVALPNTELPLITQIDYGDGHNFNDLAFGPDGYLYVAVGDEGDGGTGDDFNNAQRIDKKYCSGILRIDVDKRPGNLPPNPHPANTTHYSVPADNPWVGASSFNGVPVDPERVRTEFYAVGLRNPWRISFDPATGVLYAGDVGQHAREEINVIVKGGNYGWSFHEGTVKGPKGPPPSGFSSRSPIYEYSAGYGADQGFSVTGGVVYRGPRLPELVGAYIFADYVTGHMWALRYDGTKVTSVQQLPSQRGIAGFAGDPRDGEMLVIDHDRGKILTLEYETPSAGSALPATLAETGAFADLETLKPNPGIVPYDVNVPFWSDGAHKRRWFSVPDVNQTIGFEREGNWSFPAGTVWVKHFELTNAAAGSPRRLETRLLVKTQAGIYGATYRWGNSTQNAVLVPEEGLDEPILIQDQDGTRTQIWRYPSRSECLACHTPEAGHAIAFHTAQLNREVKSGDTIANQIQALSAAGYFKTAVSNINLLPALSSLSDTNVSREYRVRSYLAANCAQCHQPGGSARTLWDARLSTPLRSAGIVNGATSDSGGDPLNRVIQPGSAERSMLLTRIAQLGEGHMPPIAANALDVEAINLIRDWVVHDLPAVKSYEDWQQAFFGSNSEPAAAPGADPDQDGAANYLEYLTGQHPRKASDVWKIEIQRTNDLVQILFPQPANRLVEVQFTEEILAPIVWRPLDLPDNRPFFPSSNILRIITDPLANSPRRYYRVNIREP